MVAPCCKNDCLRAPRPAVEHNTAPRDTCQGQIQYMKFFQRFWKAIFSATQDKRSLPQNFASVTGGILLNFHSGSGWVILRTRFSHPASWRQICAATLLQRHWQKQDQWEILAPASFQLPMEGNCYTFPILLWISHQAGARRHIDPDFVSTTWGPCCRKKTCVSDPGGAQENISEGR